LSVAAFEVDSLVAGDERQQLNGQPRMQHTVTYAHSELNCQSVICHNVIGWSF